MNHLYVEIEKSVERVVGDTVYQATLPAWQHKETSEVIFEEAVLERWERALVKEIAYSPASSDALRLLRRWLGLKATELAKLLQTTPETISRWENKKQNVDCNAFTLLARLALENLNGREDLLFFLKSRERRVEGPVAVELHP